jgi:hypothetical protein
MLRCCALACAGGRLPCSGGVIECRYGEARMGRRRPGQQEADRGGNQKWQFKPSPAFAHA